MARKTSESFTESMFDSASAYVPEQRFDSYFIGLKESIIRGTHNRPLRWSQVFSVDGESFKEHPELLGKITSALNNIQNTDYGQQWMRDILVHPQRHARVDVRQQAYISGNSPAGYDPELNVDALLFSARVFADPSMRNAFSKIGLNRMEIVLLHEGDHAARMLGISLRDRINMRDMYENPDRFREKKYEIFQVKACGEQQAIDRANQYRRAHGLPLRGEYIDIDLYMDKVREGMRNMTPEWLEYERQNFADDINMIELLDDLSDELTEAAIINNGCSPIQDKSYLERVNKYVGMQIEAMIEAGLFKEGQLPNYDPDNVSVDDIKHGLTERIKITEDAIRRGA